MSRPGWKRVLIQAGTSCASLLSRRVCSGDYAFVCVSHKRFQRIEGQPPLPVRDLEAEAANIEEDDEDGESDAEGDVDVEDADEDVDAEGEEAEDEA